MSGRNGQLGLHAFHFPVRPTEIVKFPGGWEGDIHEFFRKHALAFRLTIFLEPDAVAGAFIHIDETNHGVFRHRQGRWAKKCIYTF